MNIIHYNVLLLNINHSFSPRLYTVCNGLGMGRLADVMTINATNIDSFKNCTKINGDISILETSLNG